MSFKEMIKVKAYELGSDLVGFGDVGRCAHAPIMMSPQGLYPACKTIIVMALKHPDGCIDRGGEEHPQKIGPYSMQYQMNSRLDEMSYRLASFIEDQGYGAIPIVSSNIWRYNEYKDLKAVFAPDVSHIYMAVVAGLADMGYSGLALTPEYGARNRFVTVLTDAEIEPDPLVPPGSVCDKCMLCRKHCPSGALSKEINGDSILKIGPYEYRFANKNLWRCAWGEHFDLDLDLKIPEKVDEALIVDMVKKHGVRCGEMGQCLKFCLPKRVRTFEKDYSKSPVRRKHVTWDESLEPRGACDKILAEAVQKGAERVFFWTAGELSAKGIDIDTVLPGAKSVVGLCIRNNQAGHGERSEESDLRFEHGSSHSLGTLCLDLCRRFEEMGFTSLSTMERSDTVGELRQKLAGIAAEQMGLSASQQGSLIFNMVVTRKTLPSLETDKGNSSAVQRKVPYHKSLTQIVMEKAREYGADLVGISSSERLDSVIEQMRGVFDGREELVAIDKSHRFKSWEPEISIKKKRLSSSTERMPGAKAVIVLGFRLHKEVVERATKPPAEAVGPYSFQTYVTQWMGSIVGVKLVKFLESYGCRAIISADLSGSGSFVGTPRGPQHDLFSNRFEAIAAGLGYMSYEGRVATPEFGLRQRFIAIVTDTALEESLIRQTPAELNACTSCDKRCIKACPAKAFTDKMVSFNCEGVRFEFRDTSRKHCDWCERYSLIAKSGSGFLGWELDELPGDEVTPENLDAALRKIDPIKKARPVIAEPCMLACPLAR